MTYFLFLGTRLVRSDSISMHAFGPVGYIPEQDRDYCQVGKASGMVQSVPCKNETTEYKH